jgi:2-dehydro-3-deoxygluconokinase
MMRLDPGDIPFSRARTCRLWHGGGETNVAEGAASTFGLRAAIVTALVDDPIGRLIERQVMEAGVDTGLIKWWMPGGDGEFATDAKGSLHNGINVTFAGKGVLPSTTDYYRAHTPIREFCQEQMDWDEIFGGHGMGARWFSTGGIYTLLSEKTAEMAQVAMAKAGTYGVMRSYDLQGSARQEPGALAESLGPAERRLSGGQPEGLLRRTQLPVRSG